MGLPKGIIGLKTLNYQYNIIVRSHFSLYNRESILRPSPKLYHDLHEYRPLPWFYYTFIYMAMEDIGDSMDHDATFDLHLHR